MSKISQFYLNTAKYVAIDEQGNTIDLEVDYWNGTFVVSSQNQELEAYAASLLSKKHRVNFVHKMHIMSAEISSETK